MLVNLIGSFKMWNSENRSARRESKLDHKIYLELRTRWRRSLTFEQWSWLKSLHFYCLSFGFGSDTSATPSWCDEREGERKCQNPFMSTFLLPERVRFVLKWGDRWGKLCGSFSSSIDLLQPISMSEIVLHLLASSSQPEKKNSLTN